MQNLIRKYPVQNPLLKNYIRFFWELRIDYTELNHKIIPQKNINLRFNLSESAHYVRTNETDKQLENTYFLGLQEHYNNLQLKITGKVDVLGVCFYSDGFFPFLKIPVSEVSNQLLGASEAGFKTVSGINDRLKEANDTAARLNILENELLLLLDNSSIVPQGFRQQLVSLSRSDRPVSFSDFCKQNNICIRTFERLFKKYIGISAVTFNKLNRFHSSLNQILRSDYSKFSDLAYDYGYFDQMHFIKDFKRFAGDTPGNYVQQKNSILQIGKFE